MNCHVSIIGSLAGVDTFEPHTETTPPDLSDNVEDDVTYRDGGATNDDGKPNEGMKLKRLWNPFCVAMHILAE